MPFTIWPLTDRRRPGPIWVLAVLVLIGCSAACASGGGSIPVDQVKDDPDPSIASGEYVIGVGDLLSVQVWDQEKMSSRLRVRSDGRISLPFVNDIQAAGKTPQGLGTELEASLKSVILTPRVTVVVDESRPLSISILGEVSKPGMTTLERGAGVAQALAAAGGLSSFAHKNRIYVLRPGPPQMRIRFTYDALIHNTGKAATFHLRPGDVVVVE